MKGLILGTAVTFLLLVLYGFQNLVYYALPLGILSVFVSFSIHSKGDKIAKRRMLGQGDVQVQKCRKLSGFFLMSGIPLVMIPLLFLL